MARSPSRTVSGSQQNRKYAPPKPATQPYIEDADADADVDPEFELSDDDEANLEAIPRSQTVNIPGDDDEDENVIGQGEHEREQNEEGLDQDGQYEDDLDEDVRSNAHVTVNNSPNRASPPGARRANHDNGRRERVYARNETPVQDMPLFTLEGTNRPAAFAFHKKISADQRRALRGRIEEYGGVVIDNEYDCDVFLCPDRYLERSQLRFIASSTVYVEPMSFINACIKSDSFRLVVPPPKLLPGRPPRTVRPYTPFTDADDRHLCEWIAALIPRKDAGGRQGERLYKIMRDVAAEEPRQEWALRHSWQSWQTRYKNRMDFFDPIIEDIVRRRPPAGNRKGQFPFLQREYMRRQQQALHEYDDQDEEHNKRVYHDSNREPARNRHRQGSEVPGAERGRAASTHSWRDTSIAPVPGRQQHRGESVRREEEEEEEEEGPPPKRARQSEPSRRLPSSESYRSRQSMPPPPYIPVAGSSQIVDPPSARIGDKRKRIDMTPEEDRASVLEPPEDGMDFSAALEKEFAIADHGRRSVQRTYSGKDRANGHDHVFESSQRTLVNPSQASPRRRFSPHRERFASPSRLRQGRRRETIAARPVDPDQDEDDLSHASPPRILTAGRSRKGKQPENQAATQEFLTQLRSGAYSQPLAPSGSIASQSRATSSETIDLTGDSDEEDDMAPKEEDNDSDADEGLVENSLMKEDTEQTGPRSVEPAIAEAEDGEDGGNMFDGVDEDSDIFRDRTISANAEQQSAATTQTSQESFRGSLSPDDAATRAALQAQTTPRMPTTHSRGPFQAASTPLPLTTGRTGRTTGSTLHSGNHPDPEDEDEDEESELSTELFPSPDTRAQRLLNEQQREAPFDAGPRARGVIIGTAHLRRSGRTKSTKNQTIR